MRAIMPLCFLMLACDPTTTLKDGGGGSDPVDSGDTGSALPADTSEGESTVIDGEGVLDGYLSCIFPTMNDFVQEGVWAGTEADGAIESVWTDDYGGGTVIEFPGAGTYEEGTVVVDFDWSDAAYPGVSFTGTATVTRD